MAKAPFCDPVDAHRARYRARAFRNESRTDLPSDFRHPDWEQGFAKHQEELAGTALPALAYLAQSDVFVGIYWERYGWVVRGVWLVFLFFPVLSLVTEPRPLWQAVLGLLLVVVFAVAYLRGSQGLERIRRGRASRWRAAAHLLVLLGCTVGTAPLIGAASLGFLPFVVAFGMFALPLAWAMAVGVASTLVAGAAAMFSSPDEGTWSVAIIVFAVGVMTGGVRLVSDRGDDYERMSRDLAIVEERERVARDVHDVLGHSLTVVTVKAELAERLVDLDPERAKAELAEIQALSRQALAEIRAISNLVGPRRRDEWDVPRALDALGRAAAAIAAREWAS